MPSIRGPSSRRRRPISVPGISSSSSVARPSTASRATAKGPSWLAPAARAWPPPPKAPASLVASTPSSRVRMEMRTPSARSLKRMATSALADWASRSMSPSACSCVAPAAGEVLEVDHRPRDAAIGRRLEARERTPEELQLGIGLGAVDASGDHGQLGAGRDQLRRHAQGAWRGVGVSEVGRCRRRGPRSGAGRCRRRPHRSRGREPACSNVTCSQVAAAAASTQVVRALARVRDVVVDVDDGHAFEERGVLAQEPPRCGPGHRHRPR